MIQELVELSKQLKKKYPEDSLEHDALDKVPVTIDCVIDKQGNFKQFIVHEKKETITERITAKKGKARLLVDKPEEVLAVGLKAEQKHKWFLDKLRMYKHINGLSPVIAFYETNSKQGVKKAQRLFNTQVEEKQRNGNIAFLLQGKRINNQQTLHNEIVKQYEVSLKEKRNLRFDRCSICGSNAYPIIDMPHGMIKRVPEGQTAGCALVSYNDKAYESYEFKGNENSSICTHCAQAYVGALNWLLSHGTPSQNDKGKDIFIYKNRKRISNDTAVVFWLRKALEAKDLDLLDEPDEEKIKRIFESIESGKVFAVKNAKSDVFYAIILSGAAARIAIREWIETSLNTLRANIAKWFRDVQVGQYNPGEKKITLYYPRFWELVRSIKSKGGKDVRHGRIGATLWKCAVIGNAPPLWVLSSILNRIRTEQGNTTITRIALLKLILNRNPKGGTKIMTELDECNINIAYICGRIFAVLESIQYHASGGNLNAGIRERFFSFASAMPATAFGRLMKLSQHHLAKIRGEKIGLAINLDKKLQELICKLEGCRFPAVLSLEDQAGFAIGYYHQRQRDFIKNKNE